jgi:hypothetical protein
MQLSLGRFFMQYLAILHHIVKYLGVSSFTGNPHDSKTLSPTIRSGKALDGAFL